MSGEREALRSAAVEARDWSRAADALERGWGREVADGVVIDLHAAGWQLTRVGDEERLRMELNAARAERDALADDEQSAFEEAERLRTLVADGIEAFRLTREYVGEDTLPAIEGWSWFDWTEKAKAALDAAPQPPSPASQGEER